MSDPTTLSFDMSSKLVDNLIAHIATLNSKGIVQNTNEAWESFEADSQIKRSDQGNDYLKMLQQAVEMGNDYALKLILGIKKVIRGEQKHFSLTYPVAQDEHSLWFRATIRPCENNSNHFVIIHEDVSSSIDEYKNEAENRYQMQFEQSMDGILITDTKGNIVDANPAASSILGWTKEEFKNSVRDDIMDVEDQKYQQALKNRDKTGNYQLGTNMICKSGKKVPVEISSNAYRNKKGDLRAIVSFRDISLRKNAERDLGRAEQFTESALNSIPGIFFVINQEANLIRWNDNMIDNLGYTDEELTEKGTLEFIKDEDKDEVYEAIQHCLETGEISVEVDIITKKNTAKTYAIEAKRFAEDGQLYLVCTGIDITETKEIERKNRENELMLQQLFDNAPVGIAIVGTDNKIQRINKNFQEIFSYSQEDAEQSNINELLVPADKMNEAEAMSMATRKGQSLKAESIRMDKDGNKVPVLIGSVPVEFNNEIIAIYGIYVDISQQHQYQQKIKHSLNEKETLLAELHHRVKNNLALITSMIDLQLFEPGEIKNNSELVNIKKRIQTIASIHEVLYEYGSLSSIPFNIFLDRVIESDTIQQQISANNVTLHTDASEIELDINQSMPCGLFLNEILSLIFESIDGSDQHEFDILLRKYGEQIHLVIESDSPVTNPDALKTEQSLHKTLVDTLAEQLKGTLLWPHTNCDYHKFEFIFTKEKYSGVTSDLLQN